MSHPKKFVVTTSTSFTDAGDAIEFLARYKELVDEQSGGFSPDDRAEMTAVLVSPPSRVGYPGRP